MSRVSDLREWEAYRQELARRTLAAFTAYTNDAYDPNWHHLRLAAELDRVLSGETKRLAVFMPPQNGKSELVSRRFPALALGRNPDWKIIHASYGAGLGTEMSRDVQRVMDTAEYQALFPGTRLASSTDQERRRANAFDVVGRRGSYEATGVGGGITGKSMILGIIDDPIKSRAEAESETYRRAVWNWYVADFSTRQMGDQARIVLVQTRWHGDDLAGRLLKLAADNPQLPRWRVVSFPAICDRLRPDDPRQIGEPLWPQRFSLAWLQAMRIEKGTYDWSALYQQEPVPEGGAMAKREWFRVAEGARSGVRRRCRCWDLAGTVPVAGRDPDWTVGTRIAQHFDGSYTVEDVVRVRRSAGDVDKLIHQTALLDGRDVLVREWQDPGAAGKSVIAAHRLMLDGWDYEPLPSSGEKSLRWRPFFVRAEGGFVHIRKAPWNTDWLDEISMVPFAAGDHDDQADSAAGAYQTLAEFKDLGPSADVIMPGSQTVGGPLVGAWQDEFFRR